MMNNIILNGVNSNTIQGLIIQELPAISKPAIRTEIEEIDGRDGDVITKLGYAAYDKQLSIGLYGDYDINQVISFFNTSGTVIFSNEPDKYYNYQILNEIDFERLVRFRTAIVTMHVQPFKYSATETPQELSGTVITGEGTNINLVNTTDSGLFTDLEIKGDTFQQTYSGKNKLNDVVMTANSNCSYSNKTLTTSNLSKGATFRLNLNQSITLNPNTDYYVSFDVKLVSGTANNLWYGGRFYDGTTYSTYTRITTPTLSSNYQRYCYKINVSSTMTPTQMVFQVDNGSGTISNVSYSITNFILSLTPNDTYEPYVGGILSPNPDYPQDVKTISGENTIRICGKNLLQTTNWLNAYIDSSGIIHNNSNINCLFDDYILVSPNTTYTISTNNSVNNIAINEFDNSKTFIKRNQYAYNISIGTFTTTLTTKYVRISFNYDNTTTITQEIIDNIEIQLELGTSETDYEAYQGQTYPINLGNIELCSINGTEDYIYKNNGTWYLHKATGKYVYNNDLSTNGDTGNTVNMVTPVLNVEPNIGVSNFTAFCNLMLSDTSSITRINGTTSQSRIRVNIVKTYAATYDEAKAIYSQKQLTIYYPLATPTDTEITDSALLNQLNALGNATTYLGTTNISTSGDELAPILYVQTVAVDDPVLRITNSGNTTAKPIMTLYGTGTINLSLNGEQIFVIDLSSENYITIDVANMEAYYNGILKNRLVTGNYENFVLNQGENEITFTGTLYSLTISNYSRWI